ncbi:hypothetical protein Q5691_17965 [Microcoleus sp. w1-18aA5]|uniref:hypothetical protein n=1 Tax=Microcoleus sp. w1-18aA5 TaxID=2818982 RepID=UPI002FD29370
MIKSVKAGGRGGKRLGSGRPSTWSTNDIKTIRVPVPLADQLLEIARYLDGQEYFSPPFYSFEDEDSKDFDGSKTTKLHYLRFCAQALTYQNNQLRTEIESLKAELKSAKKRTLRLI